MLRAVGCGALRSILTAMGLVRVAAVVQLIAFWPIGTALGMGLAFDVLGLPQFSGAMGLWIGCDLGYVFLILALLLYCKTPRIPLPDQTRALTMLLLLRRLACGLGGDVSAGAGAQRKGRGAG